MVHGALHGQTKQLETQLASLNLLILPSAESPPPTRYKSTAYRIDAAFRHPQAPLKFAHSRTLLSRITQIPSGSRRDRVRLKVGTCRRRAAVQHCSLELSSFVQLRPGAPRAGFDPPLSRRRSSVP